MRFLNLIISILVFVGIILLIVYFVRLVRKHQAVSSPTPFPTYSYSPLPLYNYNPNPTPIYTYLPTNAPIPTYTKGGYPISTAPRVSGLRGSIVFKDCSTCSAIPLAGISFEIKNSYGTIVTRATSNNQGRFTFVLPAGQYVVGPFIEPTSNAIVQATSVTINNGYYSDIDVIFTKSSN